VIEILTGIAVSKACFLGEVRRSLLKIRPCIAIQAKLGLMTVRKVVIPAAGLGTRFLPATKAQPKEMLPLIDKPAIQYVVEEAVSAGLSDVLVVTGRSKRSIEDHFDRSMELEATLREGGKDEELAGVLSIADLANMHYVRQPEAKGLGHAISFAQHHVGNEPFVVMLGDDIMVDDTVLKRMLAAYETHKCSVVALKRFPPEQISLYGCVGIDSSGVSPDGLAKISKLVEKPAAADAPSDLAIMGRYLFTPTIFDKIAKTPPGRNNEVQITDAMSLLLVDEPIIGVVFEDGRYDIGNKLDFLRATVELALSRPDLGESFRAYLRGVV
jgi:UTP--glucose-1-phosphate uridylyltransferase